MFLCVKSTLLSIQAVEIAHIVLGSCTSHLDIRGITGSSGHALDGGRYLAMLVARQPVSWIA